MPRPKNNGLGLRIVQSNKSPFRHRINLCLYKKSVLNIKEKRTNLLCLTIIYFACICFRASIKKIYYVGSFVIDQQIYLYWCLSILIVFYILRVWAPKPVYRSPKQPEYVTNQCFT